MDPEPDLWGAGSAVPHYATCQRPVNELLAAEAPVDLRGWTLRQVNMETRSAPPGATVPVCQALPYVGLTARLSTRHMTHRRVRVRLRLPGGATDSRAVRLRRRTRVTFYPDHVFGAGRYRLTVRLHGRTLGRGSLVLDGGRTC